MIVVKHINRTPLRPEPSRASGAKTQAGIAMAQQNERLTGRRMSGNQTHRCHVSRSANSNGCTQ